MKRVLVTVAVLACLTVGLSEAVPAHRTLSGPGAVAMPGLAAARDVQAQRPRTQPGPLSAPHIGTGHTESGVPLVDRECRSTGLRLTDSRPAGELRNAGCSGTPAPVYERKPPHIGTAACAANSTGKPCVRPACATAGPRTICGGRQVAWRHVGPEKWAARYRREHTRRLAAERSLARLEASANVPWLTAHVTAYASFENLTGCHTAGVCYQACGGTLNDRAYTVASNPSLGLACGTRIVVCGSRCVEATVEDRTASSFDMEFSYALALVTGATPAGWDSPRDVRWRLA